MKTLSNFQAFNQTATFKSKNEYHSSFGKSVAKVVRQKKGAKSGDSDLSLRPGTSPSQLLTNEANAEIMLGTILDMEKVCHDLYDTFRHQKAPYTALQFIPVLKVLNFNSPWMASVFFENPKTNHVLVQNDLLKVVLIHWKPGKQSSVHGHAQGGCVFKILQGKLQEKRFSPDTAQELLAVSTFKAGSMAYIDDDMAYHAVGNPFEEPAISIHVYTPGK